MNISDILRIGYFLVRDENSGYAAQYGKTKIQLYLRLQKKEIYHVFKI